jgi:hypothetical protein
MPYQKYYVDRLNHQINTITNPSRTRNGESKTTTLANISPKLTGLDGDVATKNCNDGAEPS